MKKYDFSKGEQGRFYRPGVILKLPIYLDDDLVAFIEEYANREKSGFTDSSKRYFAA